MIREDQGNRWHAILYRFAGGRWAWGTPFVADTATARQLLTPSSELWAWFSNTWRRVI